ncbi:MAG TPA: NAD(+) diphosphatase [Stellaceae bacterium]|nr:NAD(+) diphosphatase [Stellaceae bacterium]
MNDLRILFAESAHDRAWDRRTDEAWLADRLERHEATRFATFWRGRALVRETAAGLAAALVERDRIVPAEPAVLLGMIGETAYFGVELEGEEPPARLGLDAAPNLRFEELRLVAPRLSPGDAALLAHAKGLLYWHARHRFCGVCGSPTISREGGHQRRCTNPDCATSHFPRTDPAVIMLVSDGDRVLLGRQKTWPPGMYSVLAGFVEPGETLEAAVAREVLEEAGIAVRNVRYAASQPWPFPGSIMLGFRAEAASTELHPDPDEIEDVRWVERRWLIENPQDPHLRVPPGGSIARWLVDTWLAEV